MFTGIIESKGSIERRTPQGPGLRLAVRSPVIAADAEIGDSIANNGCCLTVVAIEDELLSFEAGEETLKCTNLGQLQEGDPVNLERSLQLGSRLGGHWVSGHVDAVGTLHERSDDDDWSKFWFQVPPVLTRQMACKGSIAVDGVSLTLVDVEEERFSVALIPHTLKMTTLGHYKVGARVNIETDLLAKYVERQLHNHHDEAEFPPSAD